jgi:hypothetical protein
MRERIAAAALEVGANVSDHENPAVPENDGWIDDDDISSTNHDGEDDPLDEVYLSAISRYVASSLSFDSVLRWGTWISPDDRAVIDQVDFTVTENCMPTGQCNCLP